MCTSGSARLSYTEVGQDHNTGCSPASYAQQKGRRHGWRAFLFFLSKRVGHLSNTYEVGVKQKTQPLGCIPSSASSRDTTVLLPWQCVSSVWQTSYCPPNPPWPWSPLDASSPPPPQNYRCTSYATSTPWGPTAAVLRPSTHAQSSTPNCELNSSRAETVPTHFCTPRAEHDAWDPAALSAWFWLSVLNSSKFLFGTANPHTHHFPF